MPLKHIRPICVFIKEFSVFRHTSIATAKIKIEISHRNKIGHLSIQHCKPPVSMELGQVQPPPSNPTRSPLRIDLWSNSSSLKLKWLIVFGAIVALIAIIVTILSNSIHIINEGNVGIYYKQGALLDTINYPGVHTLMPFLTNYEEISVRPQTDYITDISTVTKDGITVVFTEIQVISDVNVVQLIKLIRKFGKEYKRALVYDRISEDLRIFCANHTIDEVYNTMFLDIVNVVLLNTRNSIERLANDSIHLLNLVIPKPRIPEDIASNYKQVKVQWTEQLVATQHQKTEKIKKETESIKALLDAIREKDVLEINIQKQTLQKEGEKNLSLLDNEIAQKREETNAVIANFKKKKEAEANAILYSKEYIQLEIAKSLANNTKFYFSGDDSIIGAIMNKIFKT